MDLALNMKATMLHPARVRGQIATHLRGFASRRLHRRFSIFSNFLSKSGIYLPRHSRVRPSIDCTDRLIMTLTHIFFTSFELTDGSIRSFIRSADAPSIKMQRAQG